MGKFKEDFKAKVGELARDTEPDTESLGLAFLSEYSGKELAGKVQIIAQTLADVLDVLEGLGK